MTLNPNPNHDSNQRLRHRHRYARFVCVSDTHNSLPKLPNGDVLIHAGDLTNQGSWSELRRSLDWLSKAEGFKLKIVVAGNHDVTLDQEFYEQYGAYFRGDKRGGGGGSGNDDDQGDLGTTNHDISARVRELVASTSSSAGIYFLNHEARVFEIASDDDGEEGVTTIKTKFKIFGSPYSPSRGLWAFGYVPEDAARKWDCIPLDTDVVITHTPPKFHCDESSLRGSAGCEDLRRALWRVRPRLAVCGHIHEGRGVESVLWDLEAPNVRFKEAETFYWVDATVGSKKQYRIDLTARSARPLQNDGNAGSRESTPMAADTRERAVSPGTASAEGGQVEYGKRRLGPDIQPLWQHEKLDPHAQICSPDCEKPISQGELVDSSLPSAATKSLPVVLHPSAHGLGGLPPTGRSDVEALAGREGRRETCIVNAAITASSWPHRAGKKFNKPIVIDLPLATIC